MALTDTQKVFNYLKDGHRLTCFKAKELGLSQDLKSRICDIKRRIDRMRLPYSILTDYIKVKRTDGKMARVAEYRLRDRIK